MLNLALLERYRCPEGIANFSLADDLSSEEGYFSFGAGTLCYGRSVLNIGSAQPVGSIEDASRYVGIENSALRLPFDPVNLVENLLRENYLRNGNPERSRNAASRAARYIYYAIRPFLPVPVRRHLQKIHLRGRLKLPFPRWPVDSTVESILERCLLLSMQARGVKEIPFIWFWPEGATGCILMTHDVETGDGLDFCPRLMEINDAFGLKSCFQLIPESRYGVPPDLINSFREHGYEVAVHDLNHDGHLFSDYDEFLRRAAAINRYGREFGAGGFRSGVLYRNLEWLSKLEFSYDMSVPNVGHLEAQPGGCCTLFPYFIGETLEIPVTTTQDYSLFHILEDYSIDLWKRQLGLILEKHGMASFIVHPDYIMDEKPQRVYKELLAYLSMLRSENNVWIALPREINDWWRARSKMHLVQEGGRWLIEGPQKDRARIAYARVEDGHLSYRLEGKA